MAIRRHRSKGERIRDRRRIADLYLKGWLQNDIAAEVGLSQGTISLDLKVLHKAWVASSLVDIDIAKSRELAKIDKLEREYWKAWERSQEDAETETQRAITAGDNVRKEGTIVAKGQVGDPRFLTGILSCIDRRCKIFGIDAPEKKDHSGEIIIRLKGNVSADDV